MTHMALVELEKAGILKFIISQVVHIFFFSFMGAMLTYWDLFFMYIFSIKGLAEDGRTQVGIFYIRTSWKGCDFCLISWVINIYKFFQSQVFLSSTTNGGEMIWTCDYLVDRICLNELRYAQLGISMYKTIRKVLSLVKKPRGWLKTWERLLSTISRYRGALWL